MVEAIYSWYLHCRNGSKPVEGIDTFFAARMAPVISVEMGVSPLRALTPCHVAEHIGVRPYEVRIKWINTSLKFSKEIIKVVLINISKLRLLFTVSSTWWSIPDWSIILQHLPSAGQWQTMSILQDHNVRPYDVHKNKIWSGPHEANPTYRFTQKGFMLSLSHQEFW